MGMVNPKVQAEVIEAEEFPHLARAYQVSAVPKTVINRSVEVLGAQPEPVFLRQVLRAVGREDLLAREEGQEGPPAPS